MLIDGFTVVAQLINFLILVWLMKRFLYKPILDAIDSREKKVATQIADANSKEAATASGQADLQRKSEQFDQDRAALMSKAVEDAKTKNSQLLQQGQQDSDALRTQRMAALKNEVEIAEQAIVEKTKQEVFAMVSKTLSELASTTLEEQIGAVFIGRLRSLVNPLKESLRSALTTSSTAPLLRSSFELTADQRVSIQTAINQTFSADIPIQFELRSDLIGGMELVASGQKLSWSIADYLGAVEDSLSKLPDQPQAKVSATSPA